MNRLEKCELLDSLNNSAVVRRLDRNFPGVLIQGDTLRCILDEVEELIEETVSGDLDSISDISKILRDRFVDLLSYYEETLVKHNIEIPYMDHIKK